MPKNSYTAPINILIISPFFYPHIGGSQRYIEELYVDMIKKHSHTHVTVLAYNTNKAPVKETYRGLTIIRIPCISILPGQFAIPNPIALISQLVTLSTVHFNYVHTHIRFFDAAWWAWLYAKMISAKSIFTEHVATHPVHPNMWVRHIAKIIDQTIAKTAIHAYDIITTTNTPAKTLLKNTLGITKEIHVSYGGVDTNFFSPKPYKKKHIPEIRKPFSNDTIIVSCIGRLIWSKGLTYLFQAIKNLDTTLPSNVVFVFAGTGELQNTLQTDIRRFHLKKRIFISGPLDTTGVRNLLRITDIFIHPSHHNEGFPNSILEAASTGAFVIASDNAGTTEIISHNKTGMTIPQKNTKAIEHAILWALHNEKKRAKMAVSARFFVKQTFDWNRISESFYTLIQSNTR